MSIRRWAARTDLTQQAIVEALRKAGFVVEIIRKPTDILFRHPTWPANQWRLAEAKTISAGEKRLYTRARMKKQTDFCDRHRVYRWTSPEQALREVADVRCVSP